VGFQAWVLPKSLQSRSYPPLQRLSLRQPRSLADRLEWIPPGLGQGYPQHLPQTHNRQERTDHRRRDG
jgi:hypothetical protein